MKQIKEIIQNKKIEDIKDGKFINYGYKWIEEYILKIYIFSSKLLNFLYLLSYFKKVWKKSRKLESKEID